MGTKITARAEQEFRLQAAFEDDIICLLKIFGIIFGDICPAPVSAGAFLIFNGIFYKEYIPYFQHPTKLLALD